MGYSIGINSEGRDIGYGVPAICDHPECSQGIDRGLDYLCEGCGLFFCGNHLHYSYRRKAQVCGRCLRGNIAYMPKQDTPEWINWKLTDESWQQWRDENADAVTKMRALLAEIGGGG